MTIIARGELTRLAVPGDHVAITGIFLPMMRTGFMRMTQGLMSDTFIEAHVRPYYIALFTVLLNFWHFYNILFHFKLDTEKMKD